MCVTQSSHRHCVGANWITLVVLGICNLLLSSPTPPHGLQYRQVASEDLPFTFLVDVAVEEPNRKNCKYFSGNGMGLKTGGGSTNFGEKSRDKERWSLAADAEWVKMTLKGDADCRKNADGLDDAPLPPREQPVGTETRVSFIIGVLPQAPATRDWSFSLPI